MTLHAAWFFIIFVAGWMFLGPAGSESILFLIRLPSWLLIAYMNVSCLFVYLIVIKWCNTFSYWISLMTAEVGPCHVLLDLSWVGLQHSNAESCVIVRSFWLRFFVQVYYIGIPTRHFTVHLMSHIVGSIFDCGCEFLFLHVWCHFAKFGPCL